MRILIADDNDRVRSGIRAILRNEDLDICGEATDGKQVLNQTRQLMPDVVLLDLHMPGTDGFQVTRQLSLEFPEIKVLIVSHDDTAMILPGALRAGAAGCIDKAYLATDLAPRLRQLLGPNALPANTTTRDKEN